MPETVRLDINLSRTYALPGSNESAAPNSYAQYRMAGARAGAIPAAVRRWNVPITELGIDRGVVEHKASLQQTSFADLTEKSGSIPITSRGGLQKPKEIQTDWRYRVSAKLSALFGKNGTVQGTGGTNPGQFLPGDAAGIGARTASKDCKAHASWMYRSLKI
jgi:hypothetical protein